ncbi:YbjN domain-containing protein [Corynebacterium doosanense]|uniref:YbjN domain-containing protein n=1 Tax=Corynebacterium doosanense CAU 212 = DSM 45436 TaxID=558173 RepID=A0A097IGC0_9CORY|nr:YbjN domain-containing protein [Corynebacterium doosanense]AIT61169.1 hypothetical protein CDOO_07765 [Corynebacterium doosanense CAU 212 = DSM 45436]
MENDDIAEVTLERIEEILLTEGIECVQEGRVLRTGYSNSAIALTIDNDRLVCDSLWRGQVALSDGAGLMHALNQWNQNQIAPTLRFFEQEGSHLVVSAYRQANVSEGLSHDQLGAFVLSCLETIDAAFSYVEQQFPELVTWRYQS